MPTHMLDGPGRARLPRRPVTASLSVSGSAGGVRLEAHSEGSEDAAAILPRPSTMIMPNVQSHTVIRLVPEGEERVFPDGTTVRLTIGTEATSEHEDELVVLSELDVSGLSFRDVAALDVVHEVLEVSAMGVVRDTVLTSLAVSARAAARTVLGVDRVPDEASVNLVLAVDMSASMGPAIRNGSVAALAEVLFGLSHVVAAGKRLEVCVLGEEVIWAPRAPADQLAAAAIEIIRERAYSIGSRASFPALRGVVPGESTAVFVLTDGLPSDVAALERDGAAAGEVRHLVVACDAAAWSVRDASLSIPCTLLSPPPLGQSVADHLLDRPKVLDALVESLLVGCLSPGPAPAGRTAP